MDAIVNSAGKLRYISGGQFSFPLVALAMTGARLDASARSTTTTSRRGSSHAPGLKVVMPSNAADFKGLLKAAIRDDNPVMFFIGPRAGSQRRAKCPTASTSSRSARRRVRREGSDVTLVSYAKTVARLPAGGRARSPPHGIDAEVIDLRSLKPLDDGDACSRSVRKTGRRDRRARGERHCAASAPRSPRSLAEHAFDALKAPVARVTGPDAPAAASWVLEQAAVPQAAAIAARAMALTGTTESLA